MSCSMKTIIFLFFSFIFVNNSNAQVGIGTTTPNNTAALDISDSTRGLLIPRMTMIERHAIVNPAQGLLVYQTDNTQGIWSYNGSAWVNLLNPGFTDNPGFIHQVTSSSANLIVLYTNSTACVFTGGSWYSTNLTGTPAGSMVLGNIAMIYTTTAIFVFNYLTWSTQPITGTPKGIAGIHDMLVVSTTTNLYGFCRNDSGVFAWIIQPVFGTALGSATGETNSPFNGYCVVVYTTYAAYAFNRHGGTAQWYTQVLSGVVLGGSGTGTDVVVYTSTNAYAFDIFGTPDPAWYPVSITGTAIGILPE